MGTGAARTQHPLRRSPGYGKPARRFQAMPQEIADDMDMSVTFVGKFDAERGQGPVAIYSHEPVAR